mgnify:CR=1 FL=1
MKTQNKNKLILSLLFLILIGILLFFFFKKNNKQEFLKVVFLDVGQGDSIFIQAPNKKQILIDGGKDKKVLSKLASVMPFGDRSIDIIIGTHPDADHIGGLYHVIKNYKVGVLFEPGSTSESQIYKSLQKTIVDKDIPHMQALRGTDIILDKEKNIILKILYPDENPIGWETNDSSIIAMLSYGQTKVLLTGDSPIEKELYLIKQALSLKADILKLGHHGSRTSSSEVFLKTVSPDIAIISAGRDNSYGHPHTEVLSILNRLSLKYLETSKEGNIVCEIEISKFVCK